MFLLSVFNVLFNVCSLRVIRIIRTFVNVVFNGVVNICKIICQSCLSGCSTRFMSFRFLGLHHSQPVRPSVRPTVRSSNRPSDHPTVRPSVKPSSDLPTIRYDRASIHQAKRPCDRLSVRPTFKSVPSEARDFDVVSEHHHQNPK